MGYKKVVVVTPYVPPNIVALYVLLGKELINNGFNLEVVAIKRKPKHRKHAEVDYSGISLTILNSIQYYYQRKEIAFDVSRGLYSELINKRPDVIVFDGLGFSYIPGYMYCIRMSIKGVRIKKIFWNSNAGDLTGPFNNNDSRMYFSVKSALKWIKKIILSKHDCFLAGGTSMKKYLTRLGVQNAVVMIAPRAIMTAEEVQLIGDVNKSNKNLTIAFVGVVDERKGANLLLELVKKTSCYDDLRWIIVGSDECNLLGEITENNNVILTGNITEAEVSVVLREADVLIHPAIREPFGRVVAEALAHGCYLLLSENVGAGDDLVVDDRFGMVCRLNESDFINKINIIINNKDCIRSTAQKRRDWILENWTHNRTSEVMLESIKKCLDH